ncbi:hypothetical protein DHEL01_v202390 [Diaporthe helianthi]|uniref:Uncharacterized protein n=1 Tax=Diaporthe helianthi TaxID=158607 RepID=A0A2P5I9Q3_DIAHE|nr:hypothetical protein DHEL01_v202390 [Diaporthe helianthi]
MSPGLIDGLGGLLSGSSTLGPITGQDRTILGPLTTTFTQPPECKTAVAQVGGNALFGRLAEVCGAETGAVDTACWPTTSAGVSGPSTESPGWGFYSPGIACPAGHTSACSATGGLLGPKDWSLQYTLSARETAVGCCPNGYACDNLGGQTCVQTTTSLAVPTTNCGSEDNMILPRQTATAVTLLAPMFQIVWQSSDRVPPAAASSTSSQPTETRSSSSSAADAPGLSGTRTISGDLSPTGNLETATSSANLVQVLLPPQTVTAAAQTDAETNTAQDTDAEDQGDTKGKDAGFPVLAIIGVSVASGLAAMAVAIWAIYMWQRRRRHRKDMLQGISDDRMLRDLDNMYETTRPKTFDRSGKEEMYDHRRQDTISSRPDMETSMSYGPGQETSRFFRAGPQRTPQFVGFPSIMVPGGGRPDGLRDLAADPDYNSSYRR